MSSGHVGHRQAVELAAADRAHERRALDQLVARRREEAALRRRVPSTCGPSGRRAAATRDRSRRAELADQVDGADVDAELERRGRDDRAQLAVLEAVARPRAAARRDRLPWCASTAPRRAAPRGVRHALGQAPRVHEDERRPVRADQRGDPVVDLAPHLLAGDRAELVDRHLDARSSRAPVAGVDDAAAAGATPGEEPRRPPRSAAGSPTGRCAADAVRPPSRTRSSSRSSDSARCAPRLSSATAWISSTITVRTPRQGARLRSAVSRMNSDSGVVTRMCGGLRRHPLPLGAGVSPVRTAARIGGEPRAARRPRAPRSRRAAPRGSGGRRC